VLCVGLGGGTIPIFVHKHYPLDVHVTAVEIDPLMIDISKRWMGFRGICTCSTPGSSGSPKADTSVHRNVDVQVADVTEVVKVNEARYDMIFLDAFDHTGIPQALVDINFIKVCVISSKIVVLRFGLESCMNSFVFRIFDGLLNLSTVLLLETFGQETCHNSISCLQCSICTSYHMHQTIDVYYLIQGIKKCLNRSSLWE
jgi:hypothetical protein